MELRKLKASKIFTGKQFLNEEHVLITNKEGEVQNIVHQSEAGDDVEILEGILTPGLINCHCHLELSHLKDVIPLHTGLIEFLCSVVGKRGNDVELIQQKIKDAENEMYQNGIAAVGDIGNTADTLQVKSKSRIRWHNFVEVLSFTDEKAIENFTMYQSIARQFNEVKTESILRTSLVPHAPYSISPKTFLLINDATQNQIVSIHNQEHPAEDELYKTGGGEYLKLFKIFGIYQSPFPVTGKSSLQSCLPYFTKGQTIFLIHNTFMPEEDIVWAKEYAAANNLKLFFCLCVNANLYIENNVPPIDLFIKHNCEIVLGTDSYSSNWQLSIAKEMQSIKKHFPQLSLENILQWATLNGAKALQWHNDLGSFDKSKKPGIVLLDENLEWSRRLL